MTRCQDDLKRVRTERDALLADNAEANAQITKLEADLADCQSQLPGDGAVLFDDPMTNPDPVPLWKALEAVSPDRITLVDGARLFHTKQGDNWGGFGQRAELGKNDATNTAHLMRQGDYQRFEYEFRMEDDFQLDKLMWQTICQFKQVEPYPEDDYSPAGPALCVHVYQGAIRLHMFWNQVLSIPLAGKNIYHRLVLDTHFSSVGDGQVVMSLDNGAPVTYDGPTLTHRISTGAAIPSHVRAGIYQNGGYLDSSMSVRKARFTSL